MKRAAATIIAITILGIWSCRKVSPDNPDTKAEAHIDNASALPIEKVRLQYKDSILYFRNLPGSYFVKPTKTPKEPGYFTANPEGLQINASYGTIEVNNSESGLHYKVYYMSPDNIPLDSAAITIAGIDYEDGIFELASTSEHEKAVPLYEGNGSTFPCSSDANSEDSNNSLLQCSFDETDLDGDGSSDIDGANRKKLRVNKKNGAIDLEQSFNDGVFGSPNPANGIYKDFTIHYRLDDASKKALNKITVRLYHFSSRDQIPAWLTEELKRRKENYDAVNSPPATGNLTQSNAIFLIPKRPPLIIIVSGLTTR
jgi:hypothetical protein